MELKSKDCGLLFYSILLSFFVFAQYSVGYICIKYYSATARERERERPKMNRKQKNKHPCPINPEK